VSQLLGLASVASRVEPGLLRELRYLVPGADAGIEAEVWNHPAVVSNPNAMFVRDPEVRNDLRERFARVAPELREKVIACITAYHMGMSLELLGEELLSARALYGAKTGAWEQVRGRLLAIAAMLSHSNVETGLRRAYLEWVGEMAQRLPAGVWQDPEVGWALTKCFTAYRQERSKQEEVAIPVGLSPRALAAAEGEQQPPQTWHMAQTGAWLVFTPEPPLPSVRHSRPWSPLHTVVSSSLLVQVERDCQRESQWLAPEGTQRHRIAPLTPGEKIVVHTDYTSVTLEGFKPPIWASAMWRDTDGLWAETKANQSVARLQWRPPAGDVEGHWLAVEAPKWAAEMGRDTYGLWAVINVGRATAVMRWIPPGSFMMGSPKDELGRYDDEGPQHRVELTQGYWLMETPCTQAFWEKVTGSNPSRFKGAEHPVECVNWHAAVAFCEKLQSLLPGSGSEVFQLPTEAQWEYACRAETKAPTYSGGNTYEQLDKIAWYKDNSEGRTHRVREKAPNGWGLFDMLGDVWEWFSN